MTDVAPDFKPPWALTCWYDREAVFLELPTKSGQPYITRFPFTEQGLMKALCLMKQVWTVAEIKPTNGRSKHAMVDRMTNPRLAKAGLKGGTKDEFTEAQHEAARAALRKMGLI